MDEPVWVRAADVPLIHAEEIRESGGLPGSADLGRLDSTLNRPRQLLFYGDDDLDIFDLAAAYAYGLARNHCFPDGNKRISFLVTLVFLDLNGIMSTFSQEMATSYWLDLAAGLIPETHFAELLRRNCTRA